MGFLDRFRKTRTKRFGMSPAEWQRMERELDATLREADRKRKGGKP